MDKSTFQSTTLATLPLEIRGMILRQMFENFERVNYQDLCRWSYHNPKFPHAAQKVAMNVLEPCDYRSNTILEPGQRLNSKVKITLNPRSSSQSHWRAGQVSVLVPRKMLELVAAGVFSYIDLAFSALQMTVEVKSMKVKNAPYIVHGPDNIVESLLRDILAQSRGLKVDGRNLHAVKMHPVNITCFLPRSQRLIIPHHLAVPWVDDLDEYVYGTNGPSDIHALHVLTHQEVTAIEATSMVPKGAAKMIAMREFFLHLLMGGSFGPVTSLSTVTRCLVDSEWENETQHYFLVRCVAKGSEGWINSRHIYLRVRMSFGNRQWKITSAEIAERETSLLAPHAWASLGHLDL